jgi:hypothetical protein
MEQMVIECGEQVFYNARQVNSGFISVIVLFFEVPLRFILVCIFAGVIGFCGCGSDSGKQPAPSLPHEEVEDNVDLLSQPPVLPESSQVDLELTGGYSSYEENWEKFKSQLGFRSPEDLAYLAESVLMKTPRTELKRRMELNFFLAEVFKKKGDTQKSQEYSAAYQELMKQVTNGAEFREHQGQVDLMSRYSSRWHLENDEE